ncbi:MAG: Txe/YoeB family addiction module toxin [Streptosporangiaceae bacterium]
MSTPESPPPGSGGRVSAQHPLRPRRLGRLHVLAGRGSEAIRITRLIAEIQPDPFAGIGKPESLKGDLSGYLTRRIDDEHRRVYRADEKELKILKARYPYSD